MGGNMNSLRTRHTESPRYRRRAMAAAVLAVTAAMAVATGAPGVSGAQSSSQPIKVMVTGGFEGVPATSGSGNVPQAYDLANLVLSRSKINGQKIQVIKCNDQGSADVSAACARQ